MIDSQLASPRVAAAAGHLTLDGHDLVALARAHGTPLFVFSEARLRGNARRFRQAAEAGHPRALVCYASKACSNLAVLAAVRDEGLGVEVNSGGELYKALAAGVAPGRIVFNGVAKTVEEIREAIGQGIKAINVDSPFELRRIGETARAMGRRAEVALRLVPGVEGGATPGIRTGGSDSKFGMMPEDLPEIRAIAMEFADAIDVIGLHCHIGSQIADPDAFRDGTRFMAGQAREIGAWLGRPLRHVNLGGGYPVRCVHGPAAGLGAFDAAEDAAAMVGRVAAEAARALGPDTELLFEPGRAIVGDAAVLLTTVENIKHRGAQPWLFLDAGYHTLIDSAAVRWYFHMVTASRMGQAEAPFRVVGPLCDSADCFFDVEGEHLYDALRQSRPDDAGLEAAVVRLPRYRGLAAATAPGDIVALLDVGAYALEQMFPYCGRRRAGAVMLRCAGDIAWIRRPDTVEDLVRDDVPAG